MLVVPRHLHFLNGTFLIFFFFNLVLVYRSAIVFCIQTLNPFTLLHLLQGLNKVMDKPQAYSEGLTNSCLCAKEPRPDRDSVPKVHLVKGDIGMRRSVSLGGQDLPGQLKEGESLWRETTGENHLGWALSKVEET